MTKQEFIETIAKYVQEYAPQFDIEVCSPIIAQACVESAYGTSNKAQPGKFNFFGLKYRPGRVDCHSGYFNDSSMEQLSTGEYVPTQTDWYSFSNISDGVKAYFEFINISRYENVKHVKDPLTYITNLRNDGYATSLTYIDTIMKKIQDENLTRFDNIKEVTNMEIVQSILTNNPCYKAGRKIEVKGLMLHSVGCPQPSAEVFVKNWNREDYDRACVHGFIDANNGKVYQCLPWNHRGWHGGGSSNNTHIGVEMCEPNCIKYTSGANFTCSDKTKAIEMVNRTYNSAVELFAMLCKEFNLDPLTSICSHSEGYKMGIASGHADPEHLWRGLGLNYTMDTFRRDVKAKLNTQSVANPNTNSNVMYKVQIGAFKNRDNGVRLCNEYKSKTGMDAFVTYIDGYYKVNVGSYRNKLNAIAMLEKISDYGYTGFIATVNQ